MFQQLRWVVLVTLLLAGPTHADYAPRGMSCGSTANSALTAGSTNFMAVDPILGSEAQAQVGIGAAGTAISLYAHAAVAPSSGQSFANTVRLAGADKSITCTISDTATDCNDVSHSFSFTAGQLFAVKTVASASAASSRLSFCLGYTVP